ncbi:hypothetical protein FJU08_11625 [Martelella alba]|uniref:Uncharacterized protein n=1 Tax=Martelella alba TaxID=2590451 RepID=A0A506U7D1_9HYPH|nr:hypothetical protein [Martelella alba]TPW30322.1 hypothetical protein FJU08_11625 [Martelella alba]
MSKMTGKQGYGWAFVVECDRSDGFVPLIQRFIVIAESEQDAKEIALKKIGAPGIFRIKEQQEKSLDDAKRLGGKFGEAVDF